MSDFLQIRTVKTTVGAIITKIEEEDIKVLLTRRGYPPYQSQWCLPGGHIDPWEPARDAVIREIREEVGLNFDARFHAYFDEIIPEKKIHAVVLIFDGSTSGNLQAQTDEVTEMKWFTFEETLNLTLAFQHNEILIAYAKSKKLFNCQPLNQSGGAG